MISTTVVGSPPGGQSSGSQSPGSQSAGSQSPGSQSAGSQSAGSQSAATAAQAPAPGQPAYVPPPGVMISGFDRQYVPQQGTVSFSDLMTAANPLQHLPGIGMIYRAATDTELAPPLQILGAIAVGAATGGPLGVFAAIGENFIQTIFNLGPAVPGHVLQAADTPTSSEAPMQPTTVGSGTVTFADGSTSLPTWREGELTNFDMTQGTAADPTGIDDGASRRALAMNAYNRAVQTYGPNA